LFVLLYFFSCLLCYLSFFDLRILITSLISSNPSNNNDNSYKPITNTAWVRARLCKLQKGCTRLAAASDKVYQLLAHGRWFSPGTPASSTTKTGRHDIAEILLKVAIKHQKSINQNGVSNGSFQCHILPAWCILCNLVFVMCIVEPDVKQQSINK